MNILQDELLTVKEIAKMLKVSERTVYNWIMEGKLASIKIGNLEGKGTVRIKFSDFKKFLEKHYYA